ncbi:MAG: FRG domain-containing protein [Saprospiraceae bacterium]|nr:FRG domain-containing protein [Saprospiraceae bacterium]MCF8252155.1 FRG domain-containing protein [Saprospiraceae bacterium]MCF8282436.1 FRG domain-containing protein [Bacteroidales bacterium]MCF8313824.1 FRG domain-containing protein [Saprospiraceae bacterium]MCF8442530.1 FRG domain-containing protein [Saprospiraceae bacterium]
MDYIEIISTDKNGVPFNAESFLLYIRRSNPIWWEDDRTETPWVFRGHWDASWLLNPSALREAGNPLSNLKERITRKHTKLLEEPFVERLDVITATEALYQFAVLAESLGTQIGQDLLVQHHSPLLFGERYNPFADQELLFHIGPLAQHHGIPTLLIDWTLNPYFAAYFAVGRGFRTNSQPENICVWAFNTDCAPAIQHSKYIKNINSIKSLRVSRHANQYLGAQHGLFTVHCDFPDMKEFIQNFPEKYLGATQPPLLRQIVLPASEAEQLLQLLDREGINESQLMPSLDKVAQTVKDRWDYWARMNK